MEPSMRSNRPWLIILSSLLLLAACKAPGGQGQPVPDTSGIDLGIFDSKVLKISWLRIAPIMAPSPGERVKGRVERGEPQYSVIYSFGWLREHGLRSREKHLQGIGMMVWGYNPEGLPNEEARRLVAFLIKNGLFELPDCGDRLTAQVLKDLRASARDPGKYGYWQWGRVIIVESDRGRRVIMPHFFRQEKALLEKYKMLDRIVSQMMLLHAPRAGMRVVREGEDE
jgi:hypothetical protein